MEQGRRDQECHQEVGGSRKFLREMAQRGKRLDKEGGHSDERRRESNLKREVVKGGGGLKGCKNRVIHLKGE